MSNIEGASRIALGSSSSLEVRETMSEPKCKQCAQEIQAGESFARFKNPNPSEPVLFFHHRGRGDCYWEYLRDEVLKVQGRPRHNLKAA
jgi:predicted RNA-binding Zn-ribbon protein involved in translation (DUF1610 family)